MLLVQPRHSYAPSIELSLVGHVYFPTGLYAAAARLRSLGLDVEVTDFNIMPSDLAGEMFGVSVIGPPYVQAAREFCIKAAALAPRSKVLVGGQGIRGFNDREFRVLFGEGAVSAWDDTAVLKAVGHDGRNMLAEEDISLNDELERIPDHLFITYFSREFSFYLSQGCRYSCTFCSAVRTRRDSKSGALLAVRERYRSMEAVARELRYMVKRADALGMQELSIYLSNLDIFQSPKELQQFVGLVESLLEDSPVRLHFRGLATTQSFLALHRTEPEVIRRFVSAGLHRIGFGIDGATPAVWKGVRKPQSSESCLTAVQVASDVYRIVPEVLMVFGHEGHDDVDTLALAVGTTRWLVEEFGAIPRPHVAKGVIPGNDGWVAEENREAVEFLLSNPPAFQMLDYTCLPSWLTHKSGQFRSAVSEAFLEICQLPGTLTQYVMPEDPTLPAEELERARAFNQGKYDI